MPKVLYNRVVAFDADWAANKSQKDFIAHEKHHGLTNEQLIEAHNLCKAAVKAPAKEPAADQLNP
jgi:hypothetical protein